MSEISNAEKILGLTEYIIIRELEFLASREKVIERVEDDDGKGGVSTKLLNHAGGINELRMLAKEYRNIVSPKTQATQDETNYFEG